LTCRVETISSPSKQAPRIFQTSPEHPNARIEITRPFNNGTPTKSRQSAHNDIFDPQPPKRKPAPVLAANASDDNTRRSSRKRTVTEKTYDEFSSEISESEEEPEPKRRRSNGRAATARRTSDVKDVVHESASSSRRRSTIKAESLETTPKVKKEKIGSVWKPNSHSTPSSGGKQREREARLDRRENEELYETLQKQVTIDLLKRRYLSSYYQL